MRTKFIIEQWRIAGAFDVVDGMFRIPHPKIDNYNYFVVVSTGLDWDHVSVSLRIVKNGREHPVLRCPTWEEMCYIKELFFEDTEAVVQYHPAASEYVNHHPYCLHLWRPQIETLPIPDKILVGPS